MDKIALGAQSIAQQIIAAAFFTGAAAHCYSFTYTVMRYQAGSQLHCFSSTRWLKLLLCVGTFVASPLAQLLHPAARASVGATTGINFDVAGLAQYLTVGLYISFLAPILLILVGTATAQGYNTKQLLLKTWP